MSDLTPMTSKGFFESKKRIYFSEADIAGIAFFAHPLRWCHEVFEEFLSQSEIGWNGWFQNDYWAAPIRKSECEYLLPLLPGCSYTIQLQLKYEEGGSSFESKYFIIGEMGGEKKICAEIRLIHVFISKAVTGVAETGTKIKKIPIPSEVFSVFRHIRNF